MRCHIPVIGHFKEFNRLILIYDAQGKYFPEAGFGGVTDYALFYPQVFFNEFPECLKGVFKSLYGCIPYDDGKGFLKDVP